MNIELIKSKIIRDININWPKIYIIRYVYLELGKCLSKDIDFFYSTENKLGDLNLSYDEIMEIYNSENGNNNKVICKSASLILKSIFDSLQIDSYLVKSLNNYTKIDNNGKKEILNHWILAVSDDYNTYFLSLIADLAYIQEGMKTRHFANNIPYTKKLKDESIIQVYEGKEIKNKVLSEETLKKIDLNIGYLTKYLDSKNILEYDYMDSATNILKKELKNNKLYYSLEAYNTSFYNGLYNFNTSDKNISFSNLYLDELTEEEIQTWVYNLCYQITLKIMDITYVSINLDMFLDSNWDFYEWQKLMCKSINSYFEIHDFTTFDDNFKYSKWSKHIKNYYNYDEYGHDDIISIMDKTNAIVGIIKNKGNGRFNELLTKLAYHFIDNHYIYNSKEEKIASSKYINHKFNILFPYIMSANDIRLPFNNLNYAEQNTLIKELLEILFPEIRNNKKSKIPPILNRIHIYSIKNRDTLDYSIVFNVVGDSCIGDQYYLYDPKNNLFTRANIIDIYNNYVIISDRFKSRLEEFDEEYKIKKKKLD